MKQFNTFYIGPPPQPVTPPPQGPIGTTLGTAMNNLYSSLKKVFTYYITWLFYFWIWRRILKFDVLGPWGPPLGPPCNNFEFPAPKDDSCQVWLKSDNAFSRRWKSYFLHRAPSLTRYPPQGPIGATLGTAMNNFYSSPLTRYLHTTCI